MTGARTVHVPGGTQALVRMITKADSKRSMWQGAAARGTAIASSDLDCPFMRSRPALTKIQHAG